MNLKEYDEMIGELLEIEKSYGLTQGCCRLFLKAPLLIPPTSEKHDLASYRGFTADVKKLESLGNMKFEKFERLPHNPFNYEKLFPSEKDDDKKSIAREKDILEHSEDEEFLSMPEIN